uniref:STI1 domain-containing protein n=1 Tax=Pinguiococcus pyrenoidosus TaxID=172671 RepID=A0A7R9U615_9STRA|mmetsp:Transcript_16366/g.62182  ORF Transcript_16366/g.62182 Transcript_16366/m.62182 type:complete len:374 (+) Transcript_16366:43-1164(+)
MATETPHETLHANPDAQSAAFRMLNLAAPSPGPLIQELNDDGSVAPEPEADSDSDEDPSLMSEMLAAAEEARRAKAEAKTKEQRRLKKSFGSGFQKGFLSSKSKSKSNLTPNSNSNSNSKSNAKSKSRSNTTPGRRSGAPSEAGEARSRSEEAPTLVGKSKTAADPLRLPEVQAAMKESMAPLQAKLSEGSWLTPELMQKIQESPRLMAAMSNPAFGALLGRMQSNPSQVLKELKDSPETQELLKEFMVLMGKHFEALGAEDDAKSEAKQEEQRQVEQAARGPLAKKILEEEEAKKKAGSGSTLDHLSDRERKEVDDHLQNPEVRQLLMDEDVQRVLVEASTNPAAFHRAMQSPDIARKIRRMAHLGLVQIQQ